MSYFFLSRLIACCLLSTMVVSAHATENDSFTLGVHPYLAREELKRRFTPLCHYLSQRLGKQVKLQISKNYKSHIEHIGNNAFDIAFMGPASYVEVVSQYGKQTLLARLNINDSPVFHGVLFTSRDSDIIQTHQLAGKRMAFGSPHSTMGYLVPRYMLAKNGIPLEKLGSYEFLGNHDNVALAVLLGEFDAGAVKEEVYDKYENRGLRLLEKSSPISEHLFVASHNISTKLADEIRKAMFSLSTDNNGLHILKAIKKTVTGLVPVTDQDYDTLRPIILDPEIKHK